MRRIPWHPVLFATTIVVTAWLDAAVSPFAAFRTLAVAVLLALVLTGVIGLVLRSLTLGGMAASAVIGLMWSRQLIATLTELGGRMGWLAIAWIGLIGLALVLGARAVLRATGSLDRDRLTSILDRAAILLLVVSLGLGLLRGRMSEVPHDLAQGVPLEAAPARSETSDVPDMYVILLDGYPRADVLQFAFDLDNSDFTDALAQRGFTVATASHSDYLWTHVSVPSALNLAYVEQIPAMADVIEGRAPRQPTLRTTIADNVAFEVARQHGLTTVAVASGFEEVAPRRADVYIDGGELNEFEVSLLSSTFAGDVLSLVAPDFASGQQRSRIRFNLGVLGDVAAVNLGPRLVWVHVPAPHQPTVFGAGGSAVPVPITPHFFADSPLERGENPGEFIARYRAQLPVLNELVLSAVDSILERSAEPPVIVLFSDHGSASAVDWNATQPNQADPARLAERTGNFFAALTPSRTDIFPNDISPVDIFRLLYDAYLGTNYGRAVPPEDGGQVAPIDPSVLGSSG